MEPATVPLNPPEALRGNPREHPLYPAKKTPWLETPLVHSPSLSKLANCQIFLKLEHLQPSGSFKSRAMGSQILSHLSKLKNEQGKLTKKVHFFASSGGNAGLAAVCAAQSLGYPCTVVVPASTPDHMVDRLYAAGAEEVVKFGETIAAAGAYMKDVVMKGAHREHLQERDEGGDIAKIALHPFDDKSIWEGNSTIIDELEKQLPLVIEDGQEQKPNDDNYNDLPLPVDVIICSVGGGGLMNGLIMGLERLKQKKQQQKQQACTHKAKKIHILAAETEGTHSLSLSLSRRTLITLPRITSKAISLGVVRVSERTFQWALNPPDGIEVHSVVLSDAEAARGVLSLVDSERVLVELACGVCVDVAVGSASRSSSLLLPGADSKTDTGGEVSGMTTTSTGNTIKKRKRTPSMGHDQSGRLPPSLSACAKTEEIDVNTVDMNMNTSTSTNPSSDESDSSSLSAPMSPSSEATEVTLLSDDSTGQFKSKLHQLLPNLTPKSRVVIIVCGGSNVTLGMAAKWRKLLKNGWIEKS